MDRVLEPELMDDPTQAEAYAGADFAEENQGFVDRFKEYFPDFLQGKVLDLGCGPADIPIRFANTVSSLPGYRHRCLGADDPVGRTGSKTGRIGRPHYVAVRTV